MSRKLLVVLAVALASLTLVAAGCGGDSEESAAEETTLATTTETTETEATEETTTEEATETESEGTDFASADNCAEFAQVGAKISEALTGTSDIDQVQAAFDELAAAAPDEIKDDFDTLAEYIGTIAEAVGDVGPGETPSADALAALQSIDPTEATAASQNIANWATENCGGAATTP